MARMRLLTLASVALCATAAMCAAATASVARQQFTLYAKATQVQFIDHSDDRARGTAKNPFNADIKIPPPPKRKDSEGSRPGDSARLSFKLYRDAGLKTSVGSAVYACTFNFEHRALCEATFELTDGTMFAMGSVDFDATSFTIAVTGGTDRYVGVRGQVRSGPARKDAHRLDFTLA